MATNKVLVTPGAVKVFRGTGGDVLWTPQNTALGHGRISDVLDRGAGSVPARYLWRMNTKWVATPTAADALRLYIVGSSASGTAVDTDGGMTFGDADLTSEALLYYNCKHLGAVVATAANQAFGASGIIDIWDRYIAIAAWNAAAAKALTNTEGDHILTLTEMPDDIQAAA